MAPASPPTQPDPTQHTRSSCSQNLDDCLDKLQEIIDKAVEAVTPKEVDPAVAARVKRKWVPAAPALLRPPGHGC
jgi:hypothetical protein